MDRRWPRMLAVGFAMALAARSTMAQAGPSTPYPVLFVTQVPIGADFSVSASAFANHHGDVYAAPRGGDLWIRYTDGTLKNLTAAAGYGSTNPNGFQDATAIAVRDPAVHWSGVKAVFSMVIGSPNQYQYTTYYWQLYEISGLGAQETPVITKVAHQPANANNINPTYGSDDRILFISDRPRNGQAHLYPQLDEYELTSTNTGVWSLDPASGDLRLLNHAPSGDFAPIVDSYGRVVFTQWDHLQRDQEADADANLGTGANCDDGAQFGTFNYTDESAGSAYNLNNRTEVFPEPRPCRGDLLAGTPFVGHTFNHFFPWAVNQDGTQSEVLNHLGRHELHGYIPAARNDDPNLIDYYGQLSRFNPNFIENMFQIDEDPTSPGTYYGVDAPEFATHAAGQVIRLTAPPGLDADHIAVTYITHRDTASTTATANHSGHYRDPLVLSDGSVIAAHDAHTGADTGNGTPASSSYAFRLQTRAPASNGYMAASQYLTAGVSKTVVYWSPDASVTYTGPLWELHPVEVRPRSVPPVTAFTLPAIEQAVFDAANVDLVTFQSYLDENSLALLVGRNTTTRDDFDLQQPFNLHVAGGTQTIGKPGTIYDISFLQLFQADQLRGSTGGYGSSTPRPGRRVLAEPLHDANALTNNPPSAGPQGSVAVGADGSWAAFVPAQRAMTWQLIDASGASVVRERYWVTFQPGEVRVCGSCHGVNQFDQAGHSPPTNSPQALADLLAYWKQVAGGFVPPTAPPTPTPQPTPTAPAILACNSGIPISMPRLAASSSAGRLALSGTATLPTPWQGVDPAVNGVRIVVSGLLDVTVPGGSGWITHPAQWTFRDPTGTFGGITHMTVRNLSRTHNGKLRVTATATHLALALPAPDAVQMSVTLGTTHECAATQWNAPGATHPRCTRYPLRLVCG